MEHESKHMRALGAFFELRQAPSICHPYPASTASVHHRFTRPHIVHHDLSHPRQSQTAR